MNRAAALFVAALAMVAAARMTLAQVADTDTRPATATATAPASAASSPALTPQQKLRLQVQLNQKLLGLFEARKFDECKKLLNRLLEIDKADAVAWYNYACVHARQNNSDPALDCLDQAIKLGYANIRYMDKDPDLANLRGLERYRKLLARNEEIQRTRATKIAAVLKKETGSDYIVEVDHDRKLVFATNIDRATLDELKTALTHQSQAMWKELFAHPFEQYQTVVIPNEADAAKLSPMVGGYYQRETQRLVSRQIGMTLQHEFTHALHGADQDALGQSHCIWVLEGFSTLFESAQFGDGRIVPQPSVRMWVMQRAIRQKRNIPLKEFVRYTHTQYLKNASICYAQGSALMSYLHDKGLLKKWYDAYVATFDKDASGAVALESVLGKKLEQIEADWLKWVALQKVPPVQLGQSYLGIRMDRVSDGLKIMGVIPDSGADDAGLRAGDVLVRLDGTRMVDPEKLVAVVAEQPVGKVVQVTFRRNGKYQTVPVTLKAVPWKRPATTTSAPASTSAPATTRAAATKKAA